MVAAHPEGNASAGRASAPPRGAVAPARGWTDLNKKGHFDPETDARRFLAAIVESSDDAIIGKDLAGIILAWSRGAERLYGYTADEIRGRSIALLIPDDRRDELSYILEQTRSGRRLEHLQTVRRTKDGRLVDVSLKVSPVGDATG